MDRPISGEAAGFRWEWTGDGEDDEWNAYSREDCATLQKAVNEGEPHAQLTIGYQRYTVSFTQMIQSNVHTGTARIVRQFVLLPPEEIARRERLRKRDTFFGVKKNAAAVNRMWKKCVTAEDGDEMWFEAGVECPLSRWGSELGVAPDSLEMYAFCWKAGQAYLAVLSRAEFDMAFSELQGSSSGSSSKRCTTPKAVAKALSGSFEAGGELQDISSDAFRSYYMWAYGASVNALQCKVVPLSVAVQLWKSLLSGSYTPAGDPNDQWSIGASAKRPRFRYLKRWLDYCQSEYAMRGGADERAHASGTSGTSGAGASKTSKVEARITKDQWAMLLEFACDDVQNVEDDYDEDKYALVIDDFVEWHLEHPEEVVKVKKGKRGDGGGKRGRGKRAAPPSGTASAKKRARGGT